MFTPKHACVIVLNVKKIIINRNVKFDEMSIVPHEIMKPDPMSWLVTNDLHHWNKLKYMYVLDEVSTNSNLTFHLKLVVPRISKKNHVSKTNDLRKHLLLIFNKEVDTPPRNTSNSLSTHVLAKHEQKLLLDNFLHQKCKELECINH